MTWTPFGATNLCVEFNISRIAQMMNSEFDQVQNARDAAEIFTLLANPYRVQILALLCKGERTVTELGEAIGARPSVVSQQLRILRLRDMVSAERRGPFHYYRLAQPEIRELIECMERCPLFAPTRRNPEP